MQIWFHGTNGMAAIGVLKDGFRVGTWFARHLEDALAFGGPHVFEVALDADKVNTDSDAVTPWQVHTLEVIPPERIVGYSVFTTEMRIDNAELRKEIFESNGNGSVDGFAGKVEGHRWGIHLTHKEKAFGLGSGS